MNEQLIKDVLRWIITTKNTEMLDESDIDMVYKDYVNEKASMCDSEHIAPVVRSNATTGWISVNDRLPEDAMLYLCFGEIWYNKNIQQQFIRVVEYKNCKFRCDFNPCAYVTHWMPLPEPPKV